MNDKLEIMNCSFSHRPSSVTPSSLTVCSPPTPRLRTDRHALCPIQTL